jgi:hypothetical protein
MPVDDVQTSTAGMHQTARVASRLGTQRLSQPRDRPMQRWAVPTAAAGGG